MHGGMLHTEFRVVETEELPDDETNDDGSVTVGDGDRESIVRWRTAADRIQLFGWGLNDVLDCQYQLHVDGELSSQTESPLGTPDEPFNVAEMYGRPIVASDDVEFMVVNNSGAAKDFVGVLYLREYNVPGEDDPQPQHAGWNHGGR